MFSPFQLFCWFCLAFCQVMESWAPVLMTDWRKEGERGKGWVAVERTVPYIEMNPLHQARCVNTATTGPINYPSRRFMGPGETFLAPSSVHIYSRRDKSSLLLSPSPQRCLLSPLFPPFLTCRCGSSPEKGKHWKNTELSWSAASAGGGRQGCYDAPGRAELD